MLRGDPIMPSLTPLSWLAILGGLYYFIGEQGYALRHRKELGLHRRLSKIGPIHGVGRLLASDHHWLVYLEYGRFFYLPTIIRVAKDDVDHALREQPDQNPRVPAEWFRLRGRLDVTEREVNAVTIVRGRPGRGWRLDLRAQNKNRPRMSLWRQLHLGRQFRKRGLFSPTVQQLEELLHQLETTRPVG